jgi:tetratricopeptide (TPR) repeat protein
VTRSQIAGVALLALTLDGCASLRLPEWLPGVKPPKPPEVLGPPPRPAAEIEKLEALYTAAKLHLAERRDDDAYRALSQLTRLHPQYKDCPTLLRDLRTRLVQQHYQEGLRLFREEKIEEAIVEWRLVLEMDPTQKPARRNIEQAEQILRTLAEHRKR